MPHSQKVLDAIKEKRAEKGGDKLPWSAITKHKQDGDCWIVISGCVYDVSDYMKRHPGGKAAIMKHSGKDCTSFFERVPAHSEIARSNLPKLYVGDVGGMMSGFVPPNVKRGNDKDQKKKKKNSMCVLM